MNDWSEFTEPQRVIRLSLLEATEVVMKIKFMPPGQNVLLCDYPSIPSSGFYLNMICPSQRLCALWGKTFIGLLAECLSCVPTFQTGSRNLPCRNRLSEGETAVSRGDGALVCLWDPLGRGHSAFPSHSPGTPPVFRGSRLQPLLLPQGALGFGLEGWEEEKEVGRGSRWTAVAGTVGLTGFLNFYFLNPGLKDLAVEHLKHYDMTDSGQ